MSDAGDAGARRVTGLLSVFFFLVSVLFLLSQLIGHLGAAAVGSVGEAVWDVVKYPFLLHVLLYYGYRNDYFDRFAARAVPLLRARYWAVRHPRLHRRYRELGVEAPYLASRILTPADIERLGWAPPDLALLVTCEVARQREAAGRTGPPVWKVSGLAAWTDRRPQDAAFLAELDEHLLDLASSQEALEYLQPATGELSGHLVLWLMENRVDLEVFAEAQSAFAAYLKDFPAERGDSPNVWDGIPARGIGRTLRSKYLQNLTLWEIQGWLEHAEPLTRHSLFRRKQPHPADQALGWALWSKAAALIGERGPHPALWKAAGFAASEVPEALASEVPVPRTTLEAMAALRRPEPTGL